MRLNTIQPAIGSKKTGKRLGRGIGSGRGKTSGKGHKGQHARAGGYHKLGFEGGQMPMQRRMPKFGFRSKMSQFTQEIRLFELNDFEGETISLETLRKAKLIKDSIKTVKIILNGEIKKKLTISNDVKLTKGAKEAIIAVGGKVES
ncbi:MAG TPA: 50S ribosomal protein L15 [Gammaproteobacteria bacterium]|nr:50S ribosomal protein L15 [Gammaproteobacteria bacterium]